MRQIIKKCISFIFIIAMSFCVVGLSNTKAIADDVKYVKISVDEFKGNESKYVSTENIRYVLCGKVNSWLHPYTTTNPDYQVCVLTSFSPFNTVSIRILLKRDSHFTGSDITFNGHILGYGSYIIGDDIKNKYLEIELDNTLYSEIEGEDYRGKVYSDLYDTGLTDSDDISSCVNQYKANKVYSSLGFDYDIDQNPSSTSSTQVWTKVTNGNEITEDGIYTFCKIYNNKAVKYAIDPDTYTTGQEFPFSIELLNGDSFSIVFRGVNYTIYPAEFKINKNECNKPNWFDIKYAYNKDNTYLIEEQKFFNYEDITKFGSEIQLDDEEENDTVYLFKKVMPEDKNPTVTAKFVKYDPKSVAIRFLSYVDYEGNQAILDSKFTKAVTYGLKLSIEGKEDKYIDFSSTDMTRVTEATSNTKTDEGGVLQAVFKIKNIPMSSWDTEITVTPYIKIDLEYEVPTDGTILDLSTYIGYQESVTRTVSSFALDYYLNHSTDDGVVTHLLALKEIAEKTAQVRSEED